MSSASRSRLVRHVGDVAAAAPAAGSAPVAVPRILCFGDSLTEGFVDRGMTMHPYARRLLSSLRSAGIACSIAESGVSGELTSQMLPRLSAILAAAKEAQNPYALVILLGGTNDVCHCVAGEVILRQILQLHSMCLAHSAGTKTLALTIPEIATADPSPSLSKRPRSAESQRMDTVMEGINAAITGATSASGSLRAQLSKGRYSCMDLRALMPQWSPAAASPAADGAAADSSSSAASAAAGKFTKDPRGFWDADDVHFSRAGYDQIGEWIAQKIMEEKLLPTTVADETAAAAKDESSASAAAATQEADGTGAAIAPVSKI